MAIDIKYQPEKEYVLIAVKGMSSIEEFKTILDTITQSEQYPPNINTLWDVREQDFSSISLESMKSLIEKITMLKINKKICRTMSRVLIKLSALIDVTSYGLRVAR